MEPPAGARTQEEPTARAQSSSSSKWSLLPGLLIGRRRSLGKWSLLPGQARAHRQQTRTLRGTTRAYCQGPGGEGKEPRQVPRRERSGARCQGSVQGNRRALSLLPVGVVASPLTEVSER